MSISFTNIEEGGCDKGEHLFSRILELREMLLWFQAGLIFVNAAVVCAILESISGLEQLPNTTEPR